jgi:microcystin-dependent protein
MKRVSLGVLAVTAALAAPAQAQSPQDCFLGEIRMFAGRFAPRGWAFAHGQLLSIQSNTALFSVLESTYGGDGATTFALPDLRGRAPIGRGQGPGLSDRSLGERSGSEVVTLTAGEMPMHTHVVVAHASSAAATHIRPQGRVLAKLDPATAANIYAPGPPDVALSSEAISIGPSGSSQPHANMPPYMAINFIICTDGYYPTED